MAQSEKDRERRPPCPACGADHGPVGELVACMKWRILAQYAEIRALKLDVARLTGSLRAYRPDEPAQGLAPSAPPLRTR